MSTHNPVITAAAPEGMRVAIVKALWNGHITSRLAQSAQEALEAAGVPQKDIQTFDVPGAVELTFAASQLIETGLFDAIIVFGCVVRGDTPHFDYVCSSVTQGVTLLNSDCDIPVIFGVLTVDNEQDALDRAGGPKGDKGAEAAQTAIMMHRFNVEVRDM